jgi:hypothetical protein
MVQRLFRDSVEPAITAAMEKYSQGENITWEIALTAYPDPGTRGRFISMTILYMQLPGTVLGTSIANTAVIEPHIPVESLDEIVRALIEATLAGRSQQLAQMTDQQEQAHANGHPAPTGGPLPT